MGLSINYPDISFLYLLKSTNLALIDNLLMKSIQLILFCNNIKFKFLKKDCMVLLNIGCETEDHMTNKYQEWEKRVGLGWIQI